MHSLLPSTSWPDQGELSRRAAARYALLASVEARRAQQRLSTRRQRSVRTGFHRFAEDALG